MIKLDFTKKLPRIVKATLAHKLQAQQPDASRQFCAYAGPCAIGVVLPKKTALRFDEQHDAAILSLVSEDLVSLPFEQESDWSQLQSKHDALMGSPTHDAELQFIRILRDICGRYYPKGVKQLDAYSFVYEKSNTEALHA